MPHEPSGGPADCRPRCETLEPRLVLNAADAAYLAWREADFQVDAFATEVVAGPQSGTPSILGALDVTLLDDQGLNLIGAPGVWRDYGYRGGGYGIAVLDSGIQGDHAAFGGRVVAGHDFVNGDADAGDDNGHGTHVAGIIAGADGPHPGVAPDADLIALKVLGADGSGSYAAVEDALRWVIAHRDEHNIVALNLSLGSGNYAGNPYSFLEDEFQQLIDLGVFVAVASGNSYKGYDSQPGLAFPAISERAVSVGAVYDADVGPISWGSGAVDHATAADRVTSFTQRDARLDLMAPGAIVTAARRGGGYVSMGGTSMASPYVAAAAALVHQALDRTGRGAEATQPGILNILRATGVDVTDGDDEQDNVVNTGLTFRRIDLAAAIASIGNTPAEAPAPPPQPAPAPAPSQPAPGPGGPPAAVDPRAQLAFARNGQWLFDVDRDGVIDRTYAFGPASAQGLVADWDGDGSLDLVAFAAGVWSIDLDRDGAADAEFVWGAPGDEAFLIDFNGDGRVDPVLYGTSGPASVWAVDLDRNGTTDLAQTFGVPGDRPFVGDWNNDGRPDLGLYRDSGGLMKFFFDTAGNGGTAEAEVWFGRPGDEPFLGDFDGDGRLDPGVFRFNAAVRPGQPVNQFFFDLARDGGGAEAEVWLSQAVAGDRAVFVPVGRPFGTGLSLSVQSVAFAFGSGTRSTAPPASGPVFGASIATADPPVAKRVAVVATSPSGALPSAEVIPAAAAARPTMAEPVRTGSADSLPERIDAVLQDLEGF